MLVNTSKVGEFVGPWAINAGGFLIPIEDPWRQVENYPNARNILVRSITQGGRRPTLSMKVNCTEIYTYLDSVSGSNIGPAEISTGGGITWNEAPQDMWNTISVAHVNTPFTGGRWQYKRRRFRWTRQFIMVQDVGSAPGTPVMYRFKNDLKPAFGVQVNIKSGSFSQSTVPYYRMHITAQIEFRGKAQQVFFSPQIGDQVLFPWTAATFVS